MASLEREFIHNASKLEIENCTDIAALKEVAKGLLDVIQKQKDFIDVSFRKFYLGINEDGSQNRDRDGGP